VYTEKVMKGIDDSIHWQNAQLYAYGVAFNCLRLTLDDLFASFNNGFWVLTLVNGYSVGTWLVVFNLALRCARPSGLAAPNEPVILPAATPLVAQES
jgi:hypothetical protein